MLESPDRLLFAMGVLDGEPEMHKVLADLLEEEGDRGLAQWARAKKRNRHKRLDFVLAVLPYRTALQIGCEFLTHALDIHSDTASLCQSIRMVRDWVMDMGDEQSSEIREQNLQQNFEHGCIAMTRVPRDWLRMFNIDRVMQSMHAASKSAEIAMESERELNVRMFRSYSAECKNGVRRVAKGSREMIKPLVAEIQYQQNRPGRRRFSLSWFRAAELPETMDVDYLDVVEWQIRHLRETLANLVDSPKE